MNERIRELAEEAELNATLLFNKDKLEKFAELIVNECAKEAFEFWCNQVDCNEESAQSHIKKHFGVEQ